jgi:hypothetical protein
VRLRDYYAERGEVCLAEHYHVLAVDAAQPLVLSQG